MSRHLPDVSAAELRQCIATARRLRRCLHCRATTEPGQHTCHDCQTPAGPWPSEAPDPDPETWGALLRAEREAKNAEAPQP